MKLRIVKVVKKNSYSGEILAFFKVQKLNNFKTWITIIACSSYAYAYKALRKYIANHSPVETTEKVVYTYPEK